MRAETLLGLIVILTLLVMPGGLADAAAPPGEVLPPGENAGAPATAGRIRPIRPQISDAHCEPLPPPEGDVVYVSTESDLRDRAIHAPDGTTIVVQAGVYNIQSFVYIGHSVTLRGETGNRDDVVLDFGGMSSGHRGVLIDADDVTVADLTIQNGYDTGVEISGNDRPLLYNLHIQDINNQLVKVNPVGDGSEDGVLACSRLEYTTSAPDNYTNGISALKARRWVIRDNEWYRIRGTGNGYTGPTIMVRRDSADTVVERNLLVDCYRGIAFGNPDQSEVNHTGGVVRNNFIYASLRHDTAVEMVRATGWLVAHNTVILLNPVSGLTWGMEARYSETVGDFAYNLTNMNIWHDRDGGQGTLLGNVTDAETGWFVDAASADLHLRAGVTQTIDQAAPLGQVTDDYDGEARPAGSAPDVGADEYSTGSPSFEDSSKSVSHSHLQGGETITYTLALYEAVSASLTLTDAIPAPLAYVPGSVGIEPADKDVPEVADDTLTWSGVVTGTHPVTITFWAQVPLTTANWVIVNRALVSRDGAAPVELTATSLLNPIRIALPLVVRSSD